MEKVNFTLEEHRNAMVRWMDKVRASCKVMNVRFSVIPSTWFWRHRIRAIFLTTRVMYKMAHNPAPMVGETIGQWRGPTVLRQFLCHTITYLMVTKRQPVSAIEIMELAGPSNAARDTVLEAIKDGIELGLIEKIGDGPKTRYGATRVLIEEAALRVHCRMISDEWQEMCAFSIAYKTMRDEAMHSFHAESLGKINETDHQSYMERMYWGDDGRGNRE